MMRGVRIRWGSHLVTTLGAVAVVVPAVFGTAAQPAVAQIVCVDSPFLGFFDENEDGVLSLDEVLAVSDANAQVADVAVEMQERGITGFRYADCEPDAVPTGDAASEPTSDAAETPDPTSTASPDVQPTEPPSPTPQPADNDEDDAPLVVTTLPGVGHGRLTSQPAVTIAGAAAASRLLGTSDSCRTGTDAP